MREILRQVNDNMAKERRLRKTTEVPIKHILEIIKKKERMRCSGKAKTNYYVDSAGTELEDFKKGLNTPLPSPKKKLKK